MRTQDVDPDALQIVQRLTKFGFKAYIVGGAVRDILLARKPKDFDIATDARPNRIRKLFRSSRIIGRRFRLVHIACGRQKIIEVSTFRSSFSEPADSNIYGTLAEDAFRRDFRFNALFYCPLKQHVIDYVDGMADIRKKCVRSLVSPFKSFREDPVRMIRAVKYAALLECRIPLMTRVAIRKLRFNIQSCSKERLTEEMYKIFQSGGARGILAEACRLKLIEVLLPGLERFFKPAGRSGEGAPVFDRLAKLDEFVEQDNPPSRGDIIAILLLDLARENRHWKSEASAVVREELRRSVLPLVPSVRDMIRATQLIKQSLRRRPDGRPPDLRSFF